MSSCVLKVLWGLGGKNSQAGHFPSGSSEECLNLSWPTASETQESLPKRYYSSCFFESFFFLSREESYLRKIASIQFSPA